MNELVDLIRSHRTIRRFTEEPVDDDMIRTAVAAAQRASTSSNVQAYGLLRVRDSAKRAELARLTGGQPQVAKAGAFFVVCADQRRHRLVAEARGAPFEADLETFLVGVIDAALFAQNLVLAFESAGLGICYIGGLRNELPEADRVLGLPRDVFGLFGLCVGVPDESPLERPRLGVDAVLFDDEYPSDDVAARHVEEYDERMRAYYAEIGKPGYDWSGGIARRFSKRTREHLFEHYTAKGARLR